jgi:magnesium-transporting ATPase (P-type)
MEDNELYQTIEDVNRMNRTIDEMNRFNDPVQRDVIVGDWKRKKPLSKKDQRTSIIILLIFILLMVGAFVTFVYAEQPSTSERYEQLLDEETRQKWDKMNSQMEEIVQKEEENEQLWHILIGISAVISLGPIVRVGIDVARSKIRVNSVSGAVQGAAILVLGSLALFAINLGFFYISFKVGHQAKMALLSVITIAATVALMIWYFRRLKN